MAAMGSGTVNLLVGARTLPLKVAVIASVHREQLTYDNGESSPTGIEKR